MKIANKRDFLKKSVEALGKIYEELEKLPALRLSELKGERTALVIIDMINGFAREGALKSARVEELIPEIAKLSMACDSMGIPKLALADCHTDASPEFSAYPPHCVAGTGEAEIVDELREIGGYELMPKNSTNGFLEKKFQEWLKENPGTDTFIITGDCTDICIQQFATTLKAWFNMQNVKARIVVPVNAVDTYDFGLHDGDLTHVAALYNMLLNGIELVQGIEL